MDSENIENRNKNTVQKWIGRCNNCTVKIDAVREDMKQITADNGFGESSWEICPFCKTGGMGHAVLMRPA